MKDNFTSNVSLFCFSDSSLYPPFFSCFGSTNISTIFVVFTFFNLLLLPLYILVLWMGFKQSRHQRSVTAGSANDSDVFIYHTVIMEIIGVLGSAFSLCAIYTCSSSTVIAGYYSFLITYPGQTLFHCLTCVERYLAVVHPITYLGLKKAGRVKVRNMSIGCVWLLSFGLIGLSVLYFPDFPGPVFFAIFSIAVIVIYFCSISVIRVLIFLGLRKVGGDREQNDKSKQRAFHTIMAVMGALGFRLCGLLISNFMFNAEAGLQTNECEIMVSGFWLCLPSSLILPLLFLQRTGVLTCSCRN